MFLWAFNQHNRDTSATHGSKGRRTLTSEASKTKKMHEKKREFIEVLNHSTAGGLSEEQHIISVHARHTMEWMLF